MKFTCKKCGSTEYAIKSKPNGTGTATGLYCAKCGFWHKWLGKEEKRQYEANNGSERDELLQKIEQLEKENTKLKARLEKSVELPCKVGAPIYFLQYFCDYNGCDETTQQFCCGCREMIERERKNEKYVIHQKPFELKDLEEIGKKYFTDGTQAEQRLAELKRGEKKKNENWRI